MATAPTPTPDIEHREPVTFAAGDSLIFVKRLTEFRASQGWSLQYVLYNVDGAPMRIVVNSQPWPTAQGDDHLISVDSFAAALPVDEYILAGYAINPTSAPDGGQERHQIYRGEFILTENLPAGQSIADQHTIGEQMVAALQAKVLRLESLDIAEADIQRSRLIVEERNKAHERLKFWLEFRNWELKKQATVNSGLDQNIITPVFGGGW